MIEGAKAMGCGGCGAANFVIYKSPKGLHVECLQCKSISHIVATAKLSIEWDEKATGLLAQRPI